MTNTNNNVKYTEFQKWFITFCEEKNIDMSISVECSNGELQIGDVCSVIMSCPKEEQQEIKNKLVQIDFKNGDVYHFLRFLAKKLTTEHKAELSF